MKPAERAAASARARRSYQLLTEHEAPTRSDLGEARDRLNECRNLSTGNEVWRAVTQLEATVAATYGVPDVDQARAEGMPHPGPGAGNAQDGRAVGVHQESPTTPTPSV